LAGLESSALELCNLCLIPKHTRCLRDGRRDEMDKYDVKLDLKACYSATSGDFSIIDVPEMQFLAVDGQGDPNSSQSYSEAVGSLFSVAYALKFHSKAVHGRDFTVGPLEGLWRGSEEDYLRRNKVNWRWTMMIAQPEWIGADTLATAREKAWSKKRLPAIQELRLTRLQEGPSVQILHIGPYDDEGPVLARLHHDYMPNNGLGRNGDHHEIYLNTPGRTVPEKLKTILRQPVRRLSMD
jgi:hypothetical protein